MQHGTRLPRQARDSEAVRRCGWCGSAAWFSGQFNWLCIFSESCVYHTAAALCLAFIIGSNYERRELRTPLYFTAAMAATAAAEAAAAALLERGPGSFVWYFCSNYKVHHDRRAETGQGRQLVLALF